MGERGRVFLCYSGTPAHPNYYRRHPIILPSASFVPAVSGFSGSAPGFFPLRREGGGLVVGYGRGFTRKIQQSNPSPASSATHAFAFALNRQRKKKKKGKNTFEPNLDPQCKSRGKKPKRSLTSFFRIINFFFNFFLRSNPKDDTLNSKTSG
jgi:hypothetical protein